MPCATKKKLLLTLLAPVCAMAVAGGAALDGFIGCAPLFETGCKLLLIGSLLLLAGFRGAAGGLFTPRGSRGQLAAAVLLPLALGLCWLCPPDRSPALSELLLCFAGVLSTALWEELFFRWLGVSLFRGEEGIHPADLLWLGLVFALPHGVNLLIHPVLGQLISAFLGSFFLLGLYAATGNLFLPILAHLLLNFSNAVLGLCASPEALSHPFLGAAAEPLYWCVLIVEAILGLLFLRRSGLLRPSGK